MEPKQKAVCAGYTTVKEYNRYVRYGFFQYRGYEYQVRYGGWNAASDEEPYMQHRNEQERIDKIIAEREKQTAGEQFDFDEIFRIFDGYEEELEHETV